MINIRQCIKCWIHCCIYL